MKNKSQCSIFVPGVSEKFRSGGLMVALELREILSEIGMTAKMVATHENPAALADAFREAAQNPAESHFVVTWGPLVQKHIALIRSHIPDARILYYAQSFGWGIRVPADVPIVCVSRYVMAQWAMHAPHNLIAYIPPVLNRVFRPTEGAREIDILIHRRKQNDYCLNELLPALQKLPLRIEVLDEWIAQEKMATLLQKTKIFLYITAPHKAGWRRILPGEGFGLPALEAAACGALVGTNLLGGVTDFLTPGENCIKLDTGLESDISRIQNALAHQPDEAGKIAAQYSRGEVTQKWRAFLQNS